MDADLHAFLRELSALSVKHDIWLVADDCGVEAFGGKRVGMSDAGSPVYEVDVILRISDDNYVVDSNIYGERT